MECFGCYESRQFHQDFSVDKYKWSILEKPKSMFIASETDDDADLYRRDLILMIVLVLMMILIEIEGRCRVCRHV